MRAAKAVIVIALVMFSMVGLSAAADFMDRIVAVVNNDVITLSELNETIDTIMKRVKQSQQAGGNEELINEARKAALNGLINNLLIDQEADRLGIVVTDEDVGRALRDILDEKSLSLDQFREMLAERDATLEDYKEEMRRQIVKVKLIGQEIRSKVGVSKEEIGAYYAKHREEYEGKEARRIQQILIIVPRGTGEEKKMALRDQAEKVLARLKRGESFAQLALEYSQGPAAQAGGDLGFIERGIMLPAVDRAAFRLGTGEISDVIESSVGFHIIRIADIRGAGAKHLEEVRDEIIEAIANEKAHKKFEVWIQEQRKKSVIEIRLDG